MDNRISVSGNFISTINFAMHQNYVPIVQSITITNNTDEIINNLELKITFVPEFAKEYSYKIQSINPKSSVEINPIRLVISTEMLYSLSEKVTGLIIFDINENNQPVYNQVENIELLTYDQWCGVCIMPEILAAYITPNHPEIDKLIHKGSEIMKSWNKKPEYTGYQTNNPDNVKIQMAAIYAALQNSGIGYNMNPANYESIGQRIRLPHKVLEQKQGTCIDLALTYASCLEAAGLYPLIILIQGHCFCGCWLEQQTFADCVNDDISALQKRMVKGNEEILLVECTDFTAGKKTDFEKAVKHGRDNLNNADEFYYFIDVKRARGSGIRPIPLMIKNNGISEFTSLNNNTENMEFSAPKALERSDIGELAFNDSNLTRQQIWERKLLDFSLRNSLLNFRPSKNNLGFMPVDIAELEDRLADGKDFRILEIPSEWSMSLRNPKIFEIENDKDLIESIGAEEFKNNRLRTFYNSEELEKTLKTIFRSSKASLEENGTNTLFLALGFLKWYESDLSEKPRYAPLVLVPVDLVKSPQNKGYILRSRQEETQINITLIEYLRQIFELKIPELDPLPEDEHGIDMPLVFNTIRKAILDKKRWNIEDVIFIGQFSFGQFVMWNDIRNRSEELKSNKTVSSLMDKKLNWTPQQLNLTADMLDESISPDDMAIPLSADSSQMLAIVAAANGESFVLHGPPGTGKSQTITNMIANALYHNKSVLFVAEKMAALNVVQNRLASIGLDPFCLELHSNKSSKNNVLKQLDKALETGRIKSPEEYRATAEKLKEIRKSLNAVINGLHKKQESGISVFEAIEIFEEYSEYKNKIRFSSELLENLDSTRLAHWLELVQNFASSLNKVGDISTNPLKEMQVSEYSIQLRDRLEQLADKLINDYKNAFESARTLLNSFGISDKTDKTTIENILNICKALSGSDTFLQGAISRTDFNSIMEQLDTIYNDGLSCNEGINQIMQYFDKRVLDYDTDTALLNWKKAETSWFLAKSSQQKKLLKELQLYATNSNSVTKENILNHYNKISEIKHLKNKLEKAIPFYSEPTNGIFRGAETDWNTLKKAIDKTKNVYQSIQSLDSADQQKVINSFTFGSGLNNFDNYINTVESYISQWNEFANLGKINNHYENNTSWLNNLEQWLFKIDDNLSLLFEWSAYNQMSKQLSSENLQNVINAVENGNCNSENITDAFRCNVYYALAVKYINSDDSLRTFRSDSYEDTIIKYHNLIDEYSKLTANELVAKLSAEIPVSGRSSSNSSETAILKRAIKSNGRMMSIRKLFNEIPILLRKLCPCMLMSPISVAQYIDPSFPKFDLVIFDEASQLPTSEAVGTIARGENVIVVGDPKQLPPTSFFKSNRIDEDNIENEDLESLLDDCLSISMPQEHLKWHYRSRHESLIAYSNMQYYDNSLFTFPSPNDQISAVRLVHIDGYYDKGGTKQNKAEAEAVVAEIERRLSDEKLRNDSIGVVTFNIVQQRLIEDMLAEMFTKRPELEKFDNECAEPVFVKNLENVQGDERDIILFSIGYGPDKDGKVSMNFGPLNRDGGWRRLNVAISRARKEMTVYSTLTPEQIDLSRTRAEGVAGLKGFLKFADQNRNVTIEHNSSTAIHQDRIIMQIAEKIRSLNYEVKTNIGCSGYKIDIGIVNPEKPDTYILGILLDGKNCKNSATAKDRFVLQPNILNGLGWKIIRVWTLEWFDNPQRVIEKIQNTLENTKSEIINDEVINVEDNAFQGRKSKEIIFEKASDSIISNAQPYKSADLGEIRNQDCFYTSNFTPVIKNQILEILNTEAPVSKKLLYKKIMSAYGITRTGKRAEQLLDNLMQSLNYTTTDDCGRIFLWKSDQIPELYSIYRTADTNNKRNIEDICSEEILNAINEIINEQISLSISDLIRETALRFSFSRTGNTIDTVIRYAVEKGIQKGKLQNTNDRILKA